MQSHSFQHDAAESDAGTTACPYRGLAPFSSEYSDYFFGRKHDARQVAASAITDRIMVFFGPSGVGKSSVLGAALPRALQNLVEGTLVVPFFRWQADFYPALLDKAKTLAGLSDDSAINSMEALAERRGEPVVFVFDQFEQYFIGTDADGSGAGVHDQAFEIDLARTVNRQDLDAHVLISIREDALHELEYLRERLPNILTDPFRLDYLDETAAESAIREPLEVFRSRFGHEAGPTEIEDGLVRELLNKASRPSDTGRFETPYLQLVLERLWKEERAAHSPILRLSTYERLEGWEGIANSHVSRTLQTVLSEDERDLCAHMFDRMVTPSGMKIALLARDLADFVKKDLGYSYSDPRAEGIQGNVERVLEKLGEADSRIVRRVSVGQDPSQTRYEIFHDVLARPIRAWKYAFDAEQEQNRLRQEAEREHQRIREEAAASQRRQQAELEKEKRLAARQRRHARVLAVVSIIITSLAFAFAAAAGYAMYLTRESAVQNSRVLAQRADFALNFGDHRSALLLALEALPEEDRRTNWLFKPVTEEASAILLSAVLRPLGANLSDHQAPITRVAFSPAENIILTASEDKTAKLWAWQDDVWKPVHELEHDDAVTSAKFSPDGRFVVSGADNAWAYIWDARSGGKLAEWRIRDGGGRTVVDIGPDNERIATVVYGSDADLWIWERGDEHGEDGSDRPPTFLRRLSGEFGRTHARGTNFIAFDRDGRRVATTSWSGNARVWDVESGDLLHDLLPAERNERGVCRNNSIGHCKPAMFADFDPSNPDRLVTASLDKTALVWDLRAGRMKGSVFTKLVGHDRAVTHAEFTEDGSRIITAALDGAVRLWDADTGETLQVLQGPATVAGVSASTAMSANGQYVVASFSNKWAHVWKVPEPAALSRMQFLSGRASPSTLGSSKKRVTTAGLSVDIYDSATSGRLKATRSFGSSPMSASVDPWGLKVAVATGACVKLFKITSGREDSSLAHMLSLRHEDEQVIRTEDEHASATGKQCDTTRGSLVLYAAFDPSGRRIATASQDGTAKIWDTETGRLLAGPMRHDGADQNAVFSAVFDRDGDRVLTGSFDGTVRVWDAESGRERRKLELGAPVLAAAYSEDGQHVVVETLHVPDQPVPESAFFAKPENGHFETETRIWDIDAAEKVENLEIANAQGYPTLGRKIVLPRSQPPNRLSPVVKENLLRVLPIDFDDITQVGFSPEGGRLITLAADNSVRVWKWPPSDIYERIAYANAIVDRQLDGLAKRLSEEERRSMGLRDRD